MCDKFAVIDWACTESGAYGISERIFPLEVAEQMCREFNKITAKRGGGHMVREVDFKLTPQNLGKFTFVHSDKCECYDEIQKLIAKSIDL